jgi:integrase
MPANWAGTGPHRPTTVTRVASLISKHVDGTKLGSMRLAAVRPSQVQAWSAIEPKFSPGHAAASGGASAVHPRSGRTRSLVASSPVTRLSLPRTERERIVPLSVAQVQALAQAMPTRSKAMVITQAGLGLRIAELLALRVEDVDFLRRTVRIEWQLFRAGKRRVPPKHQDHDGCWRCRTWSASSAATRTESPTRKSGR